MDSNFFLCNLDAQCVAATVLEGLDMTLEDQYTFSTAPARPDDAQGRAILRKFAEIFVEGTPCSIRDFVELPRSYATSFDELYVLERTHQDIILYLWLRLVSFLLPDCFIIRKY
jgi:hypothetical protein